MYKIILYKDKNGKSEIYEYLKKLQNSGTKDNRIKITKINLYFNLLSKYGLALGEPYVKKLTKDIWELRPLRDRILFANIRDNEIILLSVFMKQTNKTPKNEIKKAERYLENYIKRSDKNE